MVKKYFWVWAGSEFKNIIYINLRLKHQLILGGTLSTKMLPSVGATHNIQVFHCTHSTHKNIKITA
jgi:hypothetical protein